MSTNPAAAVCEVSLMTKSDVITFVMAVKPHELDDAVMLRLLDELEEKIHCEIYGKAARAQQYGAVTFEQLSAPAPYDGLYWKYLVAMVDFLTGNHDAYAVSYAHFQSAYADYARYVQRQRGRKKRQLCC